MKTIVSSDRDVSEFLSKVEKCKRFGVDVEATSSHALADAPLCHDLMQIVGIGFGFSDNTSYYFSYGHNEGTRSPVSSIESVKRVLEDPLNIACAHNIKYEHMALRTIGIEVQAKLLCSQIAQFSLGKGLGGKNGHRLKPAARKYLKMQLDDWADVVPDGVMAHEVSADKVGMYCCDDALATLRLIDLWEPELKEYGAYKAFSEMSCEFALVLSHMREVGFAIDRNRIGEISSEFISEEISIVSEFEKLVGVHPNKNQALSKRLFREMKVWPILSGMEEGAHGEYPVNENIRKRIRTHLKKDSLGFKILELKNRHAKISKFLSTYTQTLIDKANQSLDGRLRCDFNQTVAATGRLSSSNPNLQNIPNPKKFGGIIRDAFIAEPGWILCDADYSQADLRMMAHLSEDPNLMKAYIEDVDVHQQTADLCGTDRDTGKTLNLGLIYEMMENTLAANSGLPLNEARRIWNGWHSAYYRVREYHKFMHRYVAEHGYVKTITGRLRFLPKGKINASPEEIFHIVNSKERSRKYMVPFRESSNTPDQGSVADILMLAGRNLYREWKSRGILYDYWTGEGKAKILSFVHDETICELREDFAEEGASDIQRHMENAIKLRVPMKATPALGRSWFEAH